MKTPIYDPAQALKSTNNHKELAAEIISELISTLPSEIIKIKSALKNKKTQDLHVIVHNLHGLICYCGTPRLKNSIANFEKNILNKNSNIKQFAEEFFDECQILISHMK